MVNGNKVCYFALAYNLTMKIQGEEILWVFWRCLVIFIMNSESFLNVSRGNRLAILFGEQRQSKDISYRFKVMPFEYCQTPVQVQQYNPCQSKSTRRKCTTDMKFAT